MEVLTLGDNCVDVYLEQGIGYPGGGPVNTAVYLARAGVRVAYAGAVGDDSSGRLLLGSLALEGVDTSLVQVLSGVTNLAYVRQVDGDRTFLGTRKGVRSQFRWQEIPRAVLTTARVIHTTVDGGVNDLLPLLPRGQIFLTHDFSRKFGPEHRELLPFIYAAFASVAHMTEREATELARDWLDHGTRIVVLTRGKHGSLAVTKEAVFTCGIHDVPVVDTLGAGDAFIAGYIHGLLHDEPPQRSLERGRDLAAEALQGFGAFGHGVSLGSLELAGDVLAWKRA